MSKKRRKKNWSYNAGERGRNWVRAYRQKRDGRYYVEWMDLGRRRSAVLKAVSTKEEAKRRADQLAAELAAFRPGTEPITLDQLIDRYLREVTPHKGISKQQHDRRCARLWRSFFESQPEASRGLSRTPESLDRVDWDRFVSARKNGRIPGWSQPVRDRSVEYDLKFMLAVLNWAVGASVIGASPWRPEIRTTQHWSKPKEKNPKRPSMPDDLLEGLIRHSQSWQFEAMLLLGRETGRRNSSIRRLRWADGAADSGIGGRDTRGTDRVTLTERQFGEFLTRKRDVVAVAEATRYKRVTIRLNGQGVVLRDEPLGSEIRTKRQFRIKRGQLLLSKIDARNGAFGIVPQSVDDAIITGNFWAFDADQAQIDVRYLDFFTRTASFVEFCRRSSSGTTNRRYLQEDRFLDQSLSLPPIEEQRRIVAKIERLATKVEEATGLASRARSLADSLLDGTVASEFSRLRTTSPPAQLGGLGAFVTSGPRNWSKYYSGDGYRFYRAQDIGTSGCTVDDGIQYIEPPDGKQGRKAQPMVGDLLIVITGATLGRVALFTDSHEPGFVSQHVALCRLPETLVLPEYLLCWLRGPEGQEQLVGSKYGQGKPGLNLTNIKELKLPVPDLLDQRRVVDRLNAAEREVESLVRVQQERNAGLGALLPSILDKAFKGEL